MGLNYLYEVLGSKVGIIVFALLFPGVLRGVTFLQYWEHQDPVLSLQAAATLHFWKEQDVVWCLSKRKPPGHWRGAGQRLCQGPELGTSQRFWQAPGFTRNPSCHYKQKKDFSAGV